MPPANKWYYLTAKAQVIQSQGQEMILLHLVDTAPAVKPDERYVTFT